MLTSLPATHASQSTVSPAGMARVVVVQPEQRLRLHVSRAARAQQAFKVSCMPSYADALMWVRRFQIAIVVTDIDCEPRTNFLKEVSSLLTSPDDADACSSATPPRVIARSATVGKAEWAALENNSVHGWLSPSASTAQIFESCHIVHAGGRYISPCVNLHSPGDSESTASVFDCLSNSERLVLQGVLAGHSSTLIAKALHLSPSTVETYRTRIHRKVGVVGSVELVKLAARCGLC